MTQLVKHLDIPNATLYRQLSTLVDQGLLQATRRGHYVAGPTLLSLRQFLEPTLIATELARASLIKLAEKSGAIVHMGTLENDMVTYLVKVGDDKNKLFTREGMQLEAYCTGIGKVLLADLPSEDQERYLANGPFVALTENTKVDMAVLRAELAKVKRQGFGVDNREISPDLLCIAVPILVPHTKLRLGISISLLGGSHVDTQGEQRLSIAMHKTAQEIGDSLVAAQVC